MKSRLVIAIVAMLICGCAATRDVPNRPGDARWERTYKEWSDAKTPAVELSETLVVSSPSNDAGGSSFTFTPPPLPRDTSIASSAATVTSTPSLSVGWGKQHVPAEKPSAGYNFGQRMLYVVAGVCLLGALAFWFVPGGPHLKLGGISIAAGIGIIGIAVTIEKFAWIYAYITGGGLILILAALGFALWKEYKERTLPQ